MGFDHHGDYNTFEHDPDRNLLIPSYLLHSRHTFDSYLTAWEEYKTNDSPSGNLHGGHNTVATGRGNSCALTYLGSSGGSIEQKVAPQNLLHVGSHDLDPYEYVAMVHDGITMFPMHEITYAKSLGVMPEVFWHKFVHAMNGVAALLVSIDFDVLDKDAVHPEKLAVYMPNSGGLEPSDLVTMLRIIAKSGVPVAGILGSELLPYGANGKTYQLAVEIIDDFIAHLIKYNNIFSA